MPRTGGLAAPGRARRGGRPRAGRPARRPFPAGRRLGDDRRPLPPTAAAATGRGSARSRARAARRRRGCAAEHGHEEPTHAPPRRAAPRAPGYLYWPDARHRSAHAQQRVGWHREPGGADRRGRSRHTSTWWPSPTTTRPPDGRRPSLPPRGTGLTVVPGIELSTQLDYASVHVLGYLIDPDNPALVEETARIGGAPASRGGDGLAHLGRLRARLG